MRVPRLPATLAFVGAIRGCGLGWFDQVGGRGLGGVRGIFAGFGQLTLQLGNRSLKRVKLGLECTQLSPQALAFVTGSRWVGFLTK